MVHFNQILQLEHLLNYLNCIDPQDKAKLTKNQIVLYIFGLEDNSIEVLWVTHRTSMGEP